LAEANGKGNSSFELGLSEELLNCRQLQLTVKELSLFKGL